MKTWKLTVNEDELKALIAYHSRNHVYASDVNCIDAYDISTERSQRIHDLTKRLNRETPEVESDPRLKEEMPTPEPQTTTWS